MVFIPNSKNRSKPALHRTTFDTVREAEYFSVTELEAMTGQPRSRFGAVVLKEALDNCLDACEAAGVAPEISIARTIFEDSCVLEFRDNGDGIPPDTVKRILNFRTRTSDKSVYRAPTRGLQGNAMKTIIGIPFALGSDKPVVIAARDTWHEIHARTDPAGKVFIDCEEEQRETLAGTTLTLTIPLAGEHDLDADWWARAFSLFNPHALVRIREFEAGSLQGYDDEEEFGEIPNLYRSRDDEEAREDVDETYGPTVTFPGEWRKFLPTDLTSAHWYDEAALGKLVFSHIDAATHGGPDLLLRDFVRQFRGLSGSAKAKRVCAQFTDITRLSDFDSEPRRVAQLLAVMREEGKAPHPNVLGCVGEDHFRTRFHEWYGVKRFWYKQAVGEVKGIPFVVEAAVAETREPGELFTGVNFSPTFEDPLANTLLRYQGPMAYGIKGFLSLSHASPLATGDDERAPCTAVAVHLVCPVLDVLDRGKTRLTVSAELAAEIARVLGYAVRDLQTEGEQREKALYAREVEQPFFVELLLTARERHTQQGTRLRTAPC